MDYRTILLQLDQSASADARVAFAARLAAAHGAHLVGLAQTGVNGFIRDLAVPGADFSGLTPLFEQLRADAEDCAARFEALARQAGLASFEHRIGDEDAGNALATEAMYADLAIVSQHDPAGGDAGADIPEYVAMNAPCPVLVLPRAGAVPAFERVLVAWNASPEAARAVRQALPFLQAAREVVVAAVERGAGGEGPPPGSHAMALFLERHGVTVDVRQRQAGQDRDIGSVLLALAGECGAGLLVMGCYGHSRFRELLLGGVSRTVLRRLDRPVLLAH